MYHYGCSLLAVRVMEPSLAAADTSFSRQSKGRVRTRFLGGAMMIYCVVWKMILGLLHSCGHDLQHCLNSICTSLFLKKSNFRRFSSLCYLLYLLFGCSITACPCQLNARLLSAFCILLERRCSKLHTKWGCPGIKESAHKLHLR